ncbi:MAG: DUF2961 domain-containing protein [Sedimentisphaerales bacterium]|nr:DUF2961 domain-containing protein [Sedimentisphaerales bacterium]
MRAPTQSLLRPACRRLVYRVLLALLGASLAPTVTAEELTYVDLVDRLTDLEHLAVLPEAGEKCAQWSSWDRRSRYDQASSRYIDWDANGDNNGIIRREGNEQVLAEMKGPGVIWRIWSALPREGHVKIYLDGAAEPAVDLPFIGYFNRENEPFTYPALVHQVARGQNCYVPIPYQKSCKVTAEGDWGAYYHFTYTTYPEGTVVPTFKRRLSTAETEALSRANNYLSQVVSVYRLRRDEVWTQQRVTVAPGQTETVLNHVGTQAIAGITVRMDLPDSPEDRDVLRELTLHMYWDGDSEPSVWAPLGDFFGSAPGVNRYASLPLVMTDQGFTCNWYMPFKTSAKILLTNDGDTERTVQFTIRRAPVTKPIETLGRFHAKWHRDALLPDDPERRKIDWTMLKTEGRGRFCGVMLHVWNPRGGWWGEGDEKFFVDGEKFPSTFGTGSEDYFGYAWCDPTLFENCYHNQTISMGNRGHVSVNRWHITDNVPFQQSFEAAIEKYYPNDKPTLYAATAYWYQAAGQSDPYQPVGIEQRKGYWEPIEVFRVPGAMEGEKLRIVDKSGGNARPQDMFGFGPDWSNETHLWWTDAKPTDTLELAFDVEKAGTYRLTMQLTKAIDYGVVRLYLDGKKLGDAIDLFNDGVIATGPLDMGRHELTQGQHVLKVEIVGANEKAIKSYMFGLDYLKLEETASAFYLPENPDYTILDSAADSVRFVVERTLIEHEGHLSCRSSFVDKDGNVMGWHDFGNLEGPGWAANAVGGAYELHVFGRHNKDPALAEKALSLLDHVLEGGFIDYETGFITGYRETTTNRFCLNYQHKNNWFCPGSMAKIAYQLLAFSDVLDGPRAEKMRDVAGKTARWIDTHVEATSNGWYPRRCQPDGAHYPQNAYGDADILFEKSGDGLFIIQLYAALTQRGLADYKDIAEQKANVFMEAGGFFGSINHDTYDEHECVAYAVAFRTLRQVAKLLEDGRVRAFAYDRCLAGLDQFKMTDDRNGVQTKGLLFMERSWDTAYLWENAEAALAYLEAYRDTGDTAYRRDALTILHAIAKHHQRDTGFLTEGVDWNNHVGKQHHFDEVEYGDIKYTEPLLNNLHIVEPTLLAVELGLVGRGI